MKTIASKVNDDLHLASIRKCNEKGCSPSEYVRLLLTRELRSENSETAISNLHTTQSIHPRYGMVVDSAGNVISTQKISSETESTTVSKARSVRIILDGAE